MALCIRLSQLIVYGTSLIATTLKTSFSLKLDRKTNRFFAAKIQRSQEFGVGDKPVQTPNDTLWLSLYLEFGVWTGSNSAAETLHGVWRPIFSSAVRRHGEIHINCVNACVHNEQRLQNMTMSWIQAVVTFNLCFPCIQRNSEIPLKEVDQQWRKRVSLKLPLLPVKGLMFRMSRKRYLRVSSI